MSNSVRPALGKTFTYFLDLHILLSMLPKSKGDADLLYGDREGFRRKGYSITKPQLTNVFEIITDRLGGKGGRWGLFAVEDGQRLRSSG
jgi:hypothetical protein